MKRDYWRPEFLRNAAEMLEQAAKNVNTTWPHTASSPEPIRLKAARALIEQALAAVEAAQPEDGR